MNPLHTPPNTLLYSSAFMLLMLLSGSLFAGNCAIINGTMCYWMENTTGNYCWVKPPYTVSTKTSCFNLDSCDGGLGRSGGGCYKWADCSDCQRTAWNTTDPTGNGAPDNGGTIEPRELVHDGYKSPTDLSVTMNNVTQTQLANHAWRLFIGANQGTSAQKATGGNRGTPVNSFINTGKTALYNAAGNNPLIFEAAYHRTEAFPYYTGNQPSTPINQAPVYRFQDNFTVSGQNYVNLDENNQISQNMLFFRNSTGTGSTAHGIPGKNFPVLFMAKVNAMETNYARGAVNSSGKPVTPPATGRAKPSGFKSWKFPNSIIEYKSAWRRIEDITQSDPSKYHQAQATYYVQKTGEPDPTPVTGKFALIGLHIIQKTANYPTFIFTTFEHVDVVVRDATTHKITDPAFKLSYTSLDYDTANLQANVVGAYDRNEYGLSGGKDAQTSYQLPAAGAAPSAAQKAAGLVNGDFVTVVQPKSISSAVNDVNNSVHDAIIKQDPTSIWANYRLKGAQAIPTSNSAEADYYLSNIVIESSQPGVQLFRGGVINPLINDPTTLFTNTRDGIVLKGTLKKPQGGLTGNISTDLVEGKEVPNPKYNMGGCMGCHGVAEQNGQDFSFVANGAGGVGLEVDSVHAVGATQAEITNLIKASMAHGARRYSLNK